MAHENLQIGEEGLQNITEVVFKKKPKNHQSGEVCFLAPVAHI